MLYNPQSRQHTAEKLEGREWKRLRAEDGVQRTFLYVQGAAQVHA
jgi:hypothetical protein